jgi:hypothetical protein
VWYGILLSQTQSERGQEQWMETSESNTCAVQVAGCGAGAGLVEADLPHDPWMGQFLALRSRLTIGLEYARPLVPLAINHRRTGGWRCGSGSTALGNPFLSNVCTPLLLVYNVG